MLREYPLELSNTGQPQETRMVGDLRKSLTDEKVTEKKFLMICLMIC